MTSHSQRNIFLSLFYLRNVSSITITNETRENLIMIDRKQQECNRILLSLDTIAIELLARSCDFNFIHYLSFLTLSNILDWIHAQNKKKYIFIYGKIQQLIGMRMEFKSFATNWRSMFRVWTWTLISISIEYYFNGIPLIIIRNWSDRKHYHAFIHTYI